MKLKYFVALLVSSFTLYLAIMPLRGSDFGGFTTSAFIGFIAYVYLTIFCFDKCKGKISQVFILFGVFIGLWLLELPMRVVDFKGTLASFPDILLKSSGVFCGFLYWRLKHPYNLLVMLLGSILAVFMFFQGYNFWLHKLSFGTFTGKVSPYNSSQNIEGTDQNNKQLKNQTLENKIVLLDFWHTKCGVCFEKFPQLQAFYDKYKFDDSMVIFAVNEPLEEDKEKSAFKVIEEEGYNFPVLLPNDEELPEKFGVKGYPTTFVIDRQKNVVYKGDIEGAIKMVEELKMK